MMHITPSIDVGFMKDIDQGLPNEVVPKKSTASIDQYTDFSLVHTCMKRHGR